MSAFAPLVGAKRTSISVMEVVARCDEPTTTRCPSQDDGSRCQRKGAIRAPDARALASLGRHCGRREKGGVSSYASAAHFHRSSGRVPAARL
jgi:hypothetical protein